MKLRFGLSLLVLPFLLSCGQRNASGVIDGSNYESQKPEENRSWSEVVQAQVLSDHQIRFSVERAFVDGSSESYLVYVDEQQKTLKAFSRGEEVDFGQLHCLSESNGLCVSYEIKSNFDSTFRFRREGEFKITERKTLSSRIYFRPIVILQQADSLGWKDFIFTDATAEPALRWIEGYLFLPEYSFPLKTIQFGLSGSLSEPISFYRFLYDSTSYNSDITTIQAHYKHLLTDQEEVIEWEIQKK